LPEVVADKVLVPLRRIKSLPEPSEQNSSAKPGRSHSHSAVRATGSKHKVASEDSQAQALTALIVKLSSKKSPEAVIHSLCRNVLKRDATQAFPEFLFESVCSALSSTDAAAFSSDAPQRGCFVAQESKQESKPIAVLVLKVLRDLAREAGMSFADVAGQILWHFRNTDVLSNDVSMCKTVKDLTWVDLASKDASVKPSAVVEKAFQEHANEEGRVDDRAFLKMMDLSLHVYMASEDGVTQFAGSKACFQRTELHQLFFDQAHGNGHRGITCNGLKSVLVKLAHNMSVHPAAVFNTMGNWDL